MRFLPALLFAVLFSLPAQAQVFLRFKAAPSDVREEQVIAFLEEKQFLNPELPFKIAAIDLNRDGVPEWIVRQDMASNCAAQANCKFLIAGLQEKKPVLLGRIEAARIEVQPQTLYGIHKLSVYDNPMNDFEPNVYAWKPEARTFGSIY
jgi:hypothetical protein